MSQTQPQQRRTRRPTAQQKLDRAHQEHEARKAAEQPKSEPKARKQPMGQSGHRAKFGLSDSDMLAAIRSYTSEHGWALEHVADEDILGMIGWATTLAGALAKIRPVAEWPAVSAAAD